FSRERVNECIFKFTKSNNSSVPIEYCVVETFDPQCGLVVRWLPYIIFSVALALKTVVLCLAFKFLPHFRKNLYNSIGDIIYFAVQNPDYTIPDESLCSRRKKPRLYFPINGTRAGDGSREVYTHWAQFLGK